MKAKVYYNLHNSKWSIKDCETGLVMGHADKVCLINVKPLVSQAGRKRVLRDKEKNVHAFLVGEVARVENFTPLRGRWLDAIHDVYPELPVGGNVVTYNPYKHESFVLAENEEKFQSATMVDMVANRKCIAWGVKAA
jgi:hypothetical protein